METLEGIVDLIQSGLIDRVTAYKVTEVKKRAECAHHLLWDMPRNRSEIDLHIEGGTIRQIARKHVTLRLPVCAPSSMLSSRHQSTA